jgi:hypothetical protein
MQPTAFQEDNDESNLGVRILISYFSRSAVPIRPPASTCMYPGCCTRLLYAALVAGLPGDEGEVSLTVSLSWAGWSERPGYRPRQMRMSGRPLTLGDGELMAQHQDLRVLPPRLPRGKPSTDTARNMIRKTSFKPAGRRASHRRPGQDRP